MMFLFCSREVKWGAPSRLFLLQTETAGAGRSKPAAVPNSSPQRSQKVTPGCRSFVGPIKLGDDIGRNLILDEGDTVAQLQFAFLQTLQPQEIRRRRLMQGIYRRVEIAVLLLQPCKLGFEFALILVGHDVC
jgi:hypothetical protein